MTEATGDGATQRAPVITGDKAQWHFSRTAAPRHAREVQTSASKEPTGPPASEATSSPTAVEAARRVVLLGGMFSTELGIDLGKGERELARWREMFGVTAA